MSPELTYLAATTLVISLMWIPYILNMILVRGLLNAVGYPDDPKPLAPWAQRMKNAHLNAVENLAVFAVLVLVANAAGVSSEMTAMAAMIYFWVRIIHFLSYWLKVPWVRTLTFVAGFACQVVFAVEILF